MISLGLTPEQVAQRRLGIGGSDVKRMLDDPTGLWREKLFGSAMPMPWSGCWIWEGAILPSGYGRIYFRQRDDYAHRASYVVHVGEIPEGLEIDHKCRVRDCINPDHLEAVTHAENVRRGVAGQAFGASQRAKTHCAQGHPFDVANTYVDPKGERHCRACNCEITRRRRAKCNSV